MNQTTKKLVSLFVSLILMFPAYILLHEGGHALAAISCGARITEFSILGAYMRYEGGRFTAVTLSLFHAAGTLLPVILAVVYMLAYRSGSRSVFYRIFSFFALLMPVGSILGWVVVPVLCLLGEAPGTDDAAKFIESSGLSTWVVLGGAALLFAGCLLLAWRKKIPQNYWMAAKGDAP